MVTISSYNGRVMFSASNDGRMSTPSEMDRLGALFEEELREIVCLAMDSIGGSEFKLSRKPEAATGVAAFESRRLATLATTPKSSPSGTRRLNWTEAISRA